MPKAEEKMNSQSRGGEAGLFRRERKWCGGQPWGLPGELGFNAGPRAPRGVLSWWRPQAVRETLRELGFAPG